MTNRSVFGGKEVADPTSRRRAHLVPGVIMVPVLKPLRRIGRDSAFERQLELLRLAAIRQAKMPGLA